MNHYEFTKPKPYLDQSWMILDFSQRTCNCLSNAGITTIDELNNISDKTLLKIHQFGLKCLREVRRELQLFNEYVLFHRNNAQAQKAVDEAWERNRY